MKFTMKLLILAFSLLLLFAAATSNAADERTWKGPGWYIYVVSAFGYYVNAGPYADKSTCEKALPSKHYEVDHWSCEYVEHEADL